MTGVLIRGKTEKHREKMTAETGVMQPQAKDTWGHQKLEEAGSTLPWSLQSTKSCNTLTSDFEPPKL